LEQLLARSLILAQESNNNQVGGPNLIVEIDENLFIHRKNNVVRILPQQGVWWYMP